MDSVAPGYPYIRPGRFGTSAVDNPPLGGPTGQEQADRIAGEAKASNDGSLTVSGGTTGGDATFTGTAATAGSRAVAAATLRVFRVKRKLAPGFFEVTLKPTGKAKRSCGARSGCGSSWS